MGLRMKCSKCESELIIDRNLNAYCLKCLMANDLPTKRFKMTKISKKSSSISMGCIADSHTCFPNNENYHLEPAYHKDSKGNIIFDEVSLVYKKL
jgi:hypothetical protein